MELQMPLRASIILLMCYVSFMEFGTSEVVKTLSLTASYWFTPLEVILFLFQVMGLFPSRLYVFRYPLIFYFFPDRMLKSMKQFM